MLTDPPPNYKSVSVRQVQKADKKLWQIISEKTRGNVAVQADGTQPVQVAWRTIA